MIDPASIEVWRYPNRKLFISGDTAYTTYAKIAKYIRGGAKMKAVDRHSGDDITDSILARICSEESSKGSLRYDSDLLYQAVVTAKHVSRKKRATEDE